VDISPLRTGVVKQTARDFVNRHLGSNDIAAVLYTSGRTDGTQEFTNDRQLLLNAIDKFVGRRLRPASVELLEKYYWKQLNQGIGPGDDELGPDPMLTIRDASKPVNVRDNERAYKTTAVLDTLRNLGEFMSGVRGRRKAVLLFSEGLELPMAELHTIHTSNEVITAIRDALTAAARSNVSFFALDPRGVLGFSADYIELGPQMMPEISYEIYDSLNVQRGLLDDMKASQDTLRILSEETGGFAAVDKNDLNAAFERIVNANSRYYVLGYYPPTHPRDGAFHAIEVRVKRPGLNVTARKGYASPRGRTPAGRTDETSQRMREAQKTGMGTTSPELMTALSAPLQQNGLSFVVQAAAFRDTPRAASVALAIELDGNHLEFSPNDGAFSNRLEVSFFALGDSGKPPTVSRSEYNLNLKPDTHAWVKSHGLRVNPRASLAPGRYQLRIGTRETVGGRLGTVFYDLEVPDFSKDPLMMSGLLLASPAAEAISAQRDPSPLSKLLPDAPTSSRTFDQTATISVLAELYDNLPQNQARQIDTAVLLLSETGQEVYAARDVLANGAGAAPAKPWSAYALQKDVPLKGVAPGRYLLRVEAKVRGNTQPVARETLITVQ
jgi:VWFA-related protein